MFSLLIKSGQCIKAWPDFFGVKMSDKYPRTMHFPYSPGATKDDKIIDEEDLGGLIGTGLVFTEKLDGSNVCLTNDVVFARSHAGPPPHKSFSPLKALHANLRHSIDNRLSVFAEWCYAVHSIKYVCLQHHLNIFGVRDDETGEWWDWASVVLMSQELGVPTVPVLLKGIVNNKEQLRFIVENLSGLSSVYGPEREGVVVRTYEGITQRKEKLIGIAKWVRKDHVQTSEHWKSQPIQKQLSIWNLADY